MAVSPALAPLAGTLMQVLATGSGIEVVAVPPDTRCPPRVELERAMSARVPDDLLGWIAWYRVEASLEPPVENRVRYELRDPGGHVRLRRELAILDDGCAAAAEGLALIAERFFEEVSWTASVPLPEVQSAPPEPEPPPPRRWELQLGAGARREVELAPAVSFDLRAVVASVWVASAGLVLQPPTTENLDVARVRMLSLPLRLSVRRASAARRAALEIGPAVALTGERAQAPNAETPPRYRVTAAAGAVVALRRLLGQGWSVGLEATAEVTLTAAAFQVQDRGEILKPAPFQLAVMLAVTHVFSP
jgi:hypothetical protein